MPPKTIKNRISFWFVEKYNGIEYWFAKRWLDKNFGEREYWGDYIAELQSKKAFNCIKELE